MATESKVYLDHLIPRDNLLYVRSDKAPRDIPDEDKKSLRIRDLMPGEESRADVLRKPDFQRATWAWTPEDCVLLLDSVINLQVVPSIIMWLSPDNHQYILDGGHRVSVVLAWMQDNWGQRLAEEEYGDEKVAKDSREAAREVQRLMATYKIASFRDYQAAYSEYKKVQGQNLDPEQEMDALRYSYAEIYRGIVGGNMSFNVQWVKGDYKTAEQSFLKINKSGRRLTEWETILVENRSSSFARTVMSISDISRANHSWPTKIPGEPINQTISQQAAKILETVQFLHETLFTPPYRTPIKTLQQPLLATPYTNPEKKPYYLAELLTIVAGLKGLPDDTRQLLSRDKDSSVELIVGNGLQLIVDTAEVLSHISGLSPRSLELIPALYFYNSNGTYVRSLLYGMLYWLAKGSAEEILVRKRLFAVHRLAFEQTLLKHKEDIIRRISRRIGSGREVTKQTSRYFDGLLLLLIRYNDIIDGEEFLRDHRNLIDTLKLDEKSSNIVIGTEDTENEAGINSQLFSRSQKSKTTLRTYFSNCPKCGICGGMFDPAGSVQHDHILERFRGGRTITDNQRLVHPFCNNQANREAIEGLRGGLLHLQLPVFIELEEGDGKPQQGSFIDDLIFET
jgi:hypothetical protein